MLVLDELELNEDHFQSLLGPPPYPNHLTTSEYFEDVWGPVSAALHGRLTGEYVGDISRRIGSLVRQSDLEVRVELWKEYKGCMERRKALLLHLSSLSYELPAIAGKPRPPASPTPTTFDTQIARNSQLVSTATVQPRLGTHRSLLGNIPIQRISMVTIQHTAGWGPSLEPIGEKIFQPFVLLTAPGCFFEVFGVVDQDQSLKGVTATSQRGGSDTLSLRSDLRHHGKRRGWVMAIGAETGIERQQRDLALSAAVNEVDGSNAWRMRAWKQPELSETSWKPLIGGETARVSQEMIKIGDVYDQGMGRAAQRRSALDDVENATTKDTAAGDVRDVTKKNVVKRGWEKESAPGEIAFKVEGCEEDGAKLTAEVVDVVLVKGRMAEVGTPTVLLMGVELDERVPERATLTSSENDLVELDREDEEVTPLRCRHSVSESRHVGNVDLMGRDQWQSGTRDDEQGPNQKRETLVTEAESDKDYDVLRCAVLLWGI
ncbi:hypothetical protein DFP72DRAFT_844846 [Ephemerocybe angulata]|uniref:Uncharacterized protein n=1 Tax=Ephemerocybe angulata TaxID=980116 RepID=A0A8H6I3W6_9AGAR|nr:hypothetical protein DFP72DRAFT_844846 [Tulosesus angulatus]